MIFSQYLFGNGVGRDGLNGLDLHAIGGTIEENRRSLDLWCDLQTWDVFGVLVKDKAFTNSPDESRFVEMEFRLIGPTFDDQDRIAVGISATPPATFYLATNGQAGSNMVGRNTSGGVTIGLPNSSMFVRGNEQPAFFNLVRNVNYRIKFELRSLLVMKSYIDGGEYNNLLVSDYMDPFGSVDIFPSAQVWKLKPGSRLRLIEMIAHNEGI